MTELNFKEIANQMKELEIKASRYDDLKENVDKVMTKLNEKFEEMQELLSEINPLLSVKGKIRGQYKRCVTGYGSITVDYISKIYKYLIESKDELSLPDLKSKTGLDFLHGGSESQVKLGLHKLPHISIKKDPNYLKRNLYKYIGNDTKLPDDFPTKFSEIVKKEAVGEIKDVEDDDESLRKQLPKKYSQMG